MIGKPEWFTTRKFGWGLGLKTKESIVYIAVAIGLILLISVLPIDNNIKMMASGAIIMFLLVDTLHIMTPVYSRLDERESKHQLIAETNAAYAGVVLLSLTIFHTIVAAAIENKEPDPAMILPIVFVLVGMSLVKGGTLFLLEHRG